MIKHLFFTLFSSISLMACNSAKPLTENQGKQLVSNTTYWQQHVDYKMEIDMDVKTFKYKGKQTIIYTNNSPDVLDKVFYHLYFNAFQPGSEMDVRSRTITDPDGRVKDRISKLQPSEIGYINVSSLKQNGVKVKHHTQGTILEVILNKPINPGEKVTFDMVFNAQVPKQIRRSGRDNKEGVALSMSQWYPKLAEYDFEGWHAHPYIGREFHGVWGDFDVKLTIDKNYTVGGSGYLQNANQIGHGYQDKGVQVKHNSNKLTWHFIAPNVHDFTWAADPEYIHDKLKMDDGTMLHFLYKDNPKIKENWKNLQPKTEALMHFFNKHLGKYPYKQYSVIQGGDGGMEYAMCTLITGERKFGSLVGVTAHELAHTWFQFVLATNESKHEWMDEGFTSYISDYAMNEVMDENSNFPTQGAYKNYYFLATSGKEQPQTTHADRYVYNRAYGISAYSKGSVFLEQLGYVIGNDNLKSTLKKYYTDWKFKHPTPNDFIRCAEKVSGLELDWYLNDWTRTTNTIDYAVTSIEENKFTLERIGLMPMPLDITVTYKDGSTQELYIPLAMMRGKKPTDAKVLADWSWAYPTYSYTLNKAIASLEIDATQRMADVNKENNKM